ncbi:hypothetical protein K1719_000432 [Acacia pycnantha]|nr:hypothetical protein K1719_000432 [Acacia pycnantha]
MKICAQAAISSDRPGAYDPELRAVLELATDSELYELETILFGPSYFSPLLKSIPSRTEFDRAMIGVDLQERDDYISALESRFLFLAADARSSNVQDGQLSQWKAQVLAAVKVGAGEFQSMILRSGGIFTFTKIYQLLTRKLYGKVLKTKGNHQEGGLDGALE